MEAHWWSCVLGLLCMPAVVTLDIGEVFQDPSSISYVWVNSSAEITCTTSLKDPMGLYLHRHFHSEKNVVYLDLMKFSVTKNTTFKGFAGRIHITPAKGVTDHGFTFRLSLLRPEETNLYYCEWVYTDSQYNKKTMTSKGTVFIIREGGPEEQCKNHIQGQILIYSSIIAFAVILLLFIGLLLMRCKRYKRKFRPAPAVPPPRPPRPQHMCPRHRPYLITAVNKHVNRDANMDFRGLL